MSYQRFSVRHARVALGRGWRQGWCVYDRGKRITILFDEFSEAMEHRDNISKIYLRFGW